MESEINITPGEDFAGFQELQFSNLLSAGITLLMIVAALIFFFMLVIGGIRWIMSGGDKQQTENARNQITAALVGLVIVFAAWAIANLIGYFFGGFDLFNLTLPTVL